VLSPSAVATHLGRLAPPADSAAAARRTLHAADHLRRAGLQPALPPSFLLAHPGAASGDGRAEPDPAAAHVLGYVAGRNPTYADELVLVVAALEGPAGAAVLEAARLLAADARDAIRPEATVGILLLGPPRAGVPGAEDYLRRPTWALERITRVLVVVDDPAQGEVETARWAAAGLPAEVLVPGEGGEVRIRAVHLAEAAHARAHRLAARAFATAPPPEPTTP